VIVLFQYTNEMMSERGTGVLSLHTASERNLVDASPSLCCRIVTIFLSPSNSWISKSSFPNFCKLPNLCRHKTLMKGTETVPETSVNFNQLTRLIVREDFTTINCSEIFRFYITSVVDPGSLNSATWPLTARIVEPKETAAAREQAAKTLQRQRIQERKHRGNDEGGVSYAVRVKAV
jgi:hypothetical protein